MDILHNHKATNHVLAEDANIADCDQLPVYRAKKRMTSFWDPSLNDLHRLKGGGTIAVTLFTNDDDCHPAISVNVVPVLDTSDQYQEFIDRTLGPAATNPPEPQSKRGFHEPRERQLDYAIAMHGPKLAALFGIVDWFDIQDRDAKIKAFLLA